MIFVVIKLDYYSSTVYGFFTDKLVAEEVARENMYTQGKTTFLPDVLEYPINQRIKDEI